MQSPWADWLRVLFVLQVLMLSSGRLRADDDSASPRDTTAAEVDPDLAALLAERDAIWHDARELLAIGKAAAAEEHARAVLAIEQEVLGNGAPEINITLGLIAQCLEAQEAWDAAGQTRDEVLKRSIAAYGEESYHVVDARLAVHHVEILRGLSPEERRELSDSQTQNRQVIHLYGEGRYAEATVIAEQVLETRRRILGEEHRDCATSLNNLALLCGTQGDYARAESLYRQSLGITEEVQGERHPDYAASLNGLAMLYCESGDYEQAESLYLRALEIRKEVLGERDPDYAASLGALALLYVDQGEYERAEPLYLQALEITKEVLGERHPNHAVSLNNLASLYEKRGDYDRAEILYRSSLQIQQEVLGAQHPVYASSLNNLAGLYAAQADYVRAEPLYRQALEIWETAFGKRHPTYATGLHNLAVLYFNQRDHARAESLYRQALEILKEVLGERHPDYAVSLSSLALLYVDQGEYERAEPLYLQALEITKDVLGERHPDYATRLNSLAVLYRAQADYNRAEPLYRQAAEITVEALGERHPDYALRLNNLATLYVCQEEFGRAERLFRQALEIEKEALGKRHPSYAEILNNLAVVMFELGTPRNGLPLSREAVEVFAALLESSSTVQSERQQLAMVRSLDGHASHLLSAAQLARGNADEFYPPLLASKGQVLMRQRAVRQLREQAALAPDSPAAQTFAMLGDRTRDLDRLSKLIPEADAREAHIQELGELSLKVEQLQQTLAGLSAEYRRSEAAVALTPADLAALLPSATALIDLREYDQYLPHDADSAHRWERQYVAFVIRRDQPVQVIWLGAAEPINHAVGAWRKDFGAGVSSDAAMELRRLVWLPLEAQLDGVATILVSPDGGLNEIPFAALPGEMPDTYLIEERVFVTVTAPLLLAEILADDAAQPAAPSLLLVGDVDYGADPGLMTLAVTDRGASAARDADGLGQWNRLPQTRVEVVSIDDTFNRAYRRSPTVSLREEEATEQAFREEATQATYIHIATHGYFAPEELKSILSSTRAEEATFGIFGQQDVSGWHPGLLSGIVLAGANQPPDPYRDDGVLTALEVAALDLSKVEMATLSACETGLGESAGGEGLLGLQRSFQLAGARTTVASLWKVDDTATRSLMIEFYENLWRKKTSRVEALRQAQLMMLRGSLERGSTDADAEDELGRVPPQYWAAFMLSGDWR